MGGEGGWSERTERLEDEGGEAVRGLVGELLRAEGLAEVGDRLEWLRPHRLLCLRRTRLAVKLVDRSQLSPLQRDVWLARETRLLALLRHDHLLAERSFSSHFLSVRLMGLGPWGSLADVLAERPDGLGWCPDARQTLAQLAQGLLYLHNCAGVAHRNLNAGNVILDEGGNARLADLAFATEAGERAAGTEEEEEAEGTEPGRLSREWWCAEQEYAAPELLLREPYEGPPADVWALGVLCQRTLTGTTPYPPGEELERLCRQLLGLPALPEAARRRPALLRLLSAALRPDPALRLPIHPLSQLPFFPPYRLFSPNDLPAFLTNIPTI